MNTSRRRFLQSSGALVIAFNLPAAMGPASAAEDKSFAPNAYIRIDANGRVTFIVAYVEMGQGTYTSRDRKFLRARAAKSERFGHVSGP